MSSKPFRPTHRHASGAMIEILYGAAYARAPARSLVVYRDKAGKVWARTRPDFIATYQLIEPALPLGSHAQAVRALRARGVVS